MMSQARSFAGPQGVLLSGIFLAVTAVHSSASARTHQDYVRYEHRRAPSVSGRDRHADPYAQKTYTRQSSADPQWGVPYLGRGEMSSRPGVFLHSQLDARSSAAKMGMSQHAHERFTYLASLPDGWLGDGSLAAPREAWIDAVNLYERIGAAVGDVALPSVGLTSDGEIVFTWNDNGIAGCLSVVGDGTYSFFVSSNGRSASADDAKVTDILDRDMIDIIAR